MIVFVSVLQTNDLNDLLVYILSTTGGIMLLLILFLAIYFAVVKPKEDHVCVD